MPLKIHYQPIFDLVSRPRLGRLDVFFNDIEESDSSRYGVYLWSQNASASLYPLMQHLEIALRNAIDKEARKRFGEYWWDNVGVDKTKNNWNSFKSGVELAHKNLKKAWVKAEKKKLGLPETSNLPLTSVVPVFSHDDIVASTDFGTWKSVLISAYHTSDPVLVKDYLWPSSFSKVFRRYNKFNSSPDRAREDILNAVNELKDYRNRIFHHDCIWVKSKSTSSKNAIETIRHKINLIEKLITSISPGYANALDVWGVFSQARRVCSFHELDLYTNTKPNFKFMDSDIGQIHDHFSSSATLNKTASFELNGKHLGAYILRP